MNAVRSVVAVVLIVVACVLAPVALGTLWVRAQIADTDRYVATMSSLAADQDVQEAVADALSRQILADLDVEAYADEVVAELKKSGTLTPKQEKAIEGIAATVENGLASFTQATIDKILASEQFAELWTDANRAAHQEINDLLAGDQDGALIAQNGAVTLDLAPVVAEVKQSLLNDGITAASKIPETNAEIVLFQSDQITQAQRAYSIVNMVGLLLPILALVIGLIGVLIARRRIRALTGFGIGLVIASVVTALGVFAGRTAYLDALPSNMDVPAATAVFDIITNSFKIGVVVIGIIGLLLIALAWTAARMQDRSGDDGGDGEDAGFALPPAPEDLPGRPVS